MIRHAELLCFPMGSFYTSVIANLLPRGVGRSIAAALRVVAKRTFFYIPRVIQETGVGTRLDVDLFACVLPDISDVEVSVHAVETESKRIAQAIRVGL